MDRSVNVPELKPDVELVVSCGGRGSKSSASAMSAQAGLSPLLAGYIFIYLFFPVLKKSFSRFQKYPNKVAP